MPVFPIPHHLLEFAQVHVNCINDAIQPSHPLPLSSPSVFNLFQHQGLFQWVGSLHQVAKVLELQLQISPSNEYSGLIFFRIDWFDLLASLRDSQESSPAPLLPASMCPWWVSTTSCLSRRFSKIKWVWRKILSNHCFCPESHECVSVCVFYLSMESLFSTALWLS